MHSASVKWTLVLIRKPLGGTLMKLEPENDTKQLMVEVSAVLMKMQCKHSTGPPYTAPLSVDRH